MMPKLIIDTPAKKVLIVPEHKRTIFQKSSSWNCYQQAIVETLQTKLVTIPQSFYIFTKKQFIPVGGVFQFGHVDNYEQCYCMGTNYFPSDKFVVCMPPGTLLKTTNLYDCIDLFWKSDFSELFPHITTLLPTPLQTVIRQF